MENTSPTIIKRRLQRLQVHLEQENPVILEVVKSFKSLDTVAYRLGVLPRNDSFTTRVPWWPLVSILGTFSSGKSTFINHYLGQRLQLTGNQAVDDKFTVICFSSDGVARTLPGLALDADPRFPFYQISSDIEEVSVGEGRRVDAYLQLKTCPSELLRGKIVIDSPGFDADAQRTSTLRITDQIIDLSDLVLVMFDARHPEPGAMQDSLEHLVTNTINRPDSNKFLYILNQIDATAREDNPEEVFAAWQRALAQVGLTAGRFYRIYSPDAAIPIEDETRKIRFEEKRDADLAEIHHRMAQVEVERAYRIIGVLEKTAKRIRNDFVPKIMNAKKTWKRYALWADAMVFAVLLLGLLGIGFFAGYWEGFRFLPPSWLEWITSTWSRTGVTVFFVLLVLGSLHFTLRRIAARFVTAKLQRELKPEEIRDSVILGFQKNTRPWSSLFGNKPVGWTRWAEKRINTVLQDCDNYVEQLNSLYADPSGKKRKHKISRKFTKSPISSAPVPPNIPGVGGAAPRNESKTVEDIPISKENGSKS
uniref:Dynamin family protein n=1 Tax=Candidatus Kentrum sp. SD TaxID=2126332 RepID=A0A451BJP1_9GAMM|nr:MAG: Dynamin family protein [Candidatus Kentron sp. SD]VFK41501.1 MAG: Dynamin family protein [Candidatus Kentron sp. SD]VFK78497.1 MAG: Dynamin family protein [Candidatus Kentron sp. SD]